MKTMTIRNIPDGVAAFLAGRAASEGLSINAATVALLSKAAGLAPHQRRHRDLSWLSGSWSNTEAAEFDAVVSECRKIDGKDWQ